MIILNNIFNNDEINIKDPSYVKETLMSKFEYNKQFENMENVKSIYYVGKSHFLYFFNDVIEDIIYNIKQFMETTQKNNQIGGSKKYITKIDTYDNYLEFAKKNIGKDCQWIYDIIDKKSGLDRLLYENKNFILVTEMNMKSDDLKTFHLLAFPKDKSLKSIRDLTKDDIPLLKEMVSESKKFIKDEYKIDENEVEAHFHYPPGVLLLHIHFELTNNETHRRPLREHAVSRVIENLTLDSNYYKKIEIETIVKI
jgi:diadenosine tetraphosphate (Ap4A) HIT family hydrolase